MNIYRTKILAIIISLALGSAACGISSTQAEEKPLANAGSGAPLENTNTAPQPKVENKPVALTAKSIAGSYKFETYKKGKEGYVNSLEVKDLGSGKINAYVEASYVYQANGEETFKEASGGGNLQFKDNKATGILVDDIGPDESPCHVTIAFTPIQAEIKKTGECDFYVAPNGIYKKETKKATASKPEEKVEIKGNYDTNVPYDRMQEYMGDYDNLKPGETFVALDVPVFTEVKDLEGNGLVHKDDYQLSADEKTGVGESFFTSAALVKELQPKIDSNAASLRVYSVIIQVNSTFDVYRTPYATKVEGLDADGNVLWTASGINPRRVSIKD